jgi:signal transduction histidine kinase
MLIEDKPIKILLIEDNPGDARLIREMLAKVRGGTFGLEYANRLSTGLERLAEGGIDVILLDLSLPDSQGFDTFVRAQAQALGVPIVVLTGLTDEALAVQAVQKGAQDYLVKGHVDGYSLTRAIRYAIERKRTEEALKEYSEQLEEIVEQRTKELRDAQEQLIRTERLAAIGQLSASVGHELRNPLGNISNSVYYLNMKLGDADERLRKHLGIMEQEIARSTKIINDLLGFARAKAPDLKEVQINALVKEALSHTPVPKNVMVIAELREDLSPLMADPGQIEQVFINMISNAAQAMTGGGRLEIATREEKGFIVTEFKDNGCGIPEENVKRIFEPLFTTKVRGIGLGLAVSKRLIEAHRGTIEVISQVGRGTTFSVKLPASVDGNSEAARAPTPANRRQGD